MAWMTSFPKNANNIFLNYRFAVNYLLTNYIVRCVQYLPNIPPSCYQNLPRSLQNSEKSFQNRWNVAGLPNVEDKPRCIHYW